MKHTKCFEICFFNEFKSKCNIFDYFRRKHFNKINEERSFYKREFYVLAHIHAYGKHHIMFLSKYIENIFSKRRYKDNINEKWPTNM